MSERGKSDDPERPVNEDLHQLTLLQLIFEITPIGLAVVKGSDLFFHTANLAYRGYLPSVDVDPVDQRYEEVWPPRDGFEENVLIQKVIETGEALDLDERQLRYPNGSVRHFGLCLRKLPWGEEPAVLIVIWDISNVAHARLQTERMLQSKEAELEAAVKACVEDMLEQQRYLFESAEADRKRLSEQLHSGPVQDLYGVIFQLYSLQGELEHEQVTTILTPILAKINSVNQLLRKIYAELWPPTLDSFGLPSAINGHLRSLRESYPEIQFQVDLAPNEQVVLERLGIALFRIYEAGITNVLHHAEAKRVKISLSVGDEMVLEIRDDGNGFRVPDNWKEFARNGQYGLANSAERARSLGGRLEVVSEAGDGTRLKVYLPRSAGE